MTTATDTHPSALEATRRVKRLPGATVFTVLLVALIVTMVLAIGIGPLRLSPATVFDAILHPNDVPSATAHVVWELRIPRVIQAAIVGAALAVAGAALQGLFGNPLADPGIVGVTAGASLGAIMAIVLGLTIFGAWTIPFMAFIFGTGTTALIYVLARPGSSGGTAQLLLVGIAITSITGAVNGFFTYIADTDELEDVVFWSMGSLNIASWATIGASLPFFIVGGIIMISLARSLDVLSLGEKQARHVGLNVNLTRMLLVVSTSIVVASAVATAGSIGFVGLVIPHIVRTLVGPGHRWVLPISLVGGAFMLVAADIGARTANPPSEVPIGLFTGLVGGPFFLWLLYRSGRNKRK